MHEYLLFLDKDFSFCCIFQVRLLAALTSFVSGSTWCGLCNPGSFSNTSGSNFPLFSVPVSSNTVQKVHKCLLCNLLAPDSGVVSLILGLYRNIGLSVCRSCIAGSYSNIFGLLPCKSAMIQHHQMIMDSKGTL